MTTAADRDIMPRQPAALPALRAADRGVADALQSVLSNNTRRVYAAQWRLFNEWCDSVGLPSLPAQPLTVARYLAVRAGDGAAVATQRPHHRGPLQDRRGGCRRRGGHHPRRHACPGRHPAGGRG